MYQQENKKLLGKYYFVTLYRQIGNDPWWRLWPAPANFFCSLRWWLTFRRSSTPWPPSTSRPVAHSEHEVFLQPVCPRITCPIYMTVYIISTIANMQYQQHPRVNSILCLSSCRLTHIQSEFISDKIQHELSHTHFIWK